MSLEIDVVIIGTGMAGSTIAHKCRSQGLSVAVIDNKPYGGTCALRGCDPKKVLFGATEVLDWANRMDNYGIEKERMKINWSDLMKFKESFVLKVPKNNEKRYAQTGISTLHGHAKFVAPNQVSIEGEIIEAKFIVIATGSKARDLGIPGKEFAIDNEEFLNLTKLPKSIIFIGGGYISFEFAHIANRAGADVSIIHRNENLLKSFESELVNELINESKNIGIEFKLKEEVTKIEQTNGSYKVHTHSGNVYETNLVVHGAGRQPSIDGLDLDEGNVEFTDKGIKVNQFLQSTSNSMVYAAGDVVDNSSLKLTPVAVSEGHVVASNIIKGNYKTVNPLGISSVVFTLPSLASVGFTEETANNNGLEFSINLDTTTSWYSVKRTRENIAMYKVLVEKETGLIIGAHLLGSGAAEVINLFAMAIQFRIPAIKVRQMIFAYPTHGSDIVHMV